MHADERLRIEEMRGQTTSPPEASHDPRDGLLISVLVATRTPDEVEQLGRRLLEVAEEARRA